MSASLDVLEALRKEGSMSAAELLDHLGRSARSIGASLRQLRNRKMVYVSGHVPHPPGTPGALTPLYSVGSKKDVVHRAMTKNERARAYADRNRAMVRTKTRIAEKSKTNFWSGLL